MKDPILDERYVYGFCTWHDSIHKCGNTGPQKMKVNGREIESLGLPCCPFCGSMLMEVATKKIWDAGVDEHNKNFPGYADYVAWSQGKCFKNFDLAINEYNRVHNTSFNRASFGFNK